MRWPLRRVLVTGPSMAPALRHGDQLLVWLAPRRTPMRPGAVVVIALPEGGLGVKRVVWTAADGSTWVEGDNPFASTDSRAFGPLPADALVGRVLLRLWPRPGQVPSSPGRGASSSP